MCFPRVSPLGHCIFQSRVPGLTLFAVASVYECECGKTTPIRATRYPPPTSPFSSSGQPDGSSGHCRHARRTVIGFSRLLSFPRGKFLWICERRDLGNFGRSTKMQPLSVQPGLETGAGASLLVSRLPLVAASSPSLSPIYRQTGCFSTGRIFSCATISSVVQ